MCGMDDPPTLEWLNYNFTVLCTGECHLPPCLPVIIDRYKYILDFSEIGDPREYFFFVTKLLPFP